MKIQALTLKNFKRFTKLSIQNIPKTARLVVLVGPNGSGKSSLFDALLHWYRGRTGLGINTDNNYYRKSISEEFNWQQSVIVSVHDGAEPKLGSVYIRTAYRNEPDFNVQGFNRSSSPAEAIRFNRLIENDVTVSENYQRLVADTAAALYDESNDSKTVKALREELIGKIRASLKNVFTDLQLNNISDPFSGGTFFFQKGTSSSYLYKNLSGGEKAAFDLILDVHLKAAYFQDAIYCIDEMETHLHTRVQGTLLKELVSVVPKNSQLWVTTHSLGVLRAAQEIEVASPGSVCLIDFEGVDADQPTVLLPASLGRAAWEKMLSIALDDLSKRISPRHIVVCEGSSVGNRRKNFDAEVYDRIFSPHVADVVFISGGSSSQVAGNAFTVAAALAGALSSTKVTSLTDRDDRSQNEIAQIENGGGIVLGKRNIESYLLADDVLAKLAGTPDQAAILMDEKKSALTKSVSRGNPHDDLKSAAGEIYVAAKKILSLTGVGNNAEAFMRDTLAPLITPELETYAILKKDIIDRLPGALTA